MLAIRLQASQNCLYVIGLMTHVAADMLVLVVSEFVELLVEGWG